MSASTLAAAACVPAAPTPTVDPAPPADPAPVAPLAPICAAADSTAAESPATEAAPSATPAASDASSTEVPVADDAAASPPTGEGEGAAEVELAAMIDGGLEIVTVPEGVAAAAAQLLDAAGTLLGAGPVVEVGIEEEGSATSADAVATDPLRASQWALDVVPVEPLWACATGSGVDIAVIDTGVASDHPDLAGRVSPGVSTLDGTTQPGAGGTDTHGHGTHVAGIAAAGASDGVGIAGAAPSATVMPVKVLRPDGAGSSDDVARGIRWAVDNGAEVLNLSLSGSYNSVAISEAISYAVQNGVPVLAAAGNGGTSGVTRYPAADPNVIAVGAISSLGTVASFSSRGWWVDVAAPGQSILSSIPGGWGTKSGTSMASPYVAGMTAVIMSSRGAVSPSALYLALTSTALDAGAAGVDVEYGYGVIDPTAALNSL